MTIRENINVEEEQRDILLCSSISKCTISVGGCGCDDHQSNS